MTVTLYTGYLALGTGTSSFTEQAGTGYARVAVTLNYNGNRVSNSAAITFTAGAGDWGAVTQIGVWSASSSGTNKFWWPVTSTAVANGATYTVAINALKLFMNDAIIRGGELATYVSGNTIGQDSGGNVIKAGSSLTFINQSLSAVTPALYAATGALPTADPHVVGQLWANSTVVTVSAG